MSGVGSNGDGCICGAVLVTVTDAVPESVALEYPPRWRHR